MSRVVHFEIHAAHPERAILFYEKVFGWKFQEMDGPVGYWLITTGPADLPGINGGLVSRRGEIDGQAVIAFVCTIDVPSVDDTIELILSIEGQIVVAKFPVPGVGWRVYCKDTEGNIFGISEADSQAGS